MAAFKQRLTLIKAGDLEGAAAVTGCLSKAARAELSGLVNDVGDLGEMDTTHVSRILPIANRASGERTHWTAHSMAESRDLIKSFLSSVPTKCENCGCCSPKAGAVC